MRNINTGWSADDFTPIFFLLHSQGVNTMDTRKVDIRIPLSEVPFVMRAMGFYPSEQEVTQLLCWVVDLSVYLQVGRPGLKPQLFPWGSAVRG